MRQISFKRRRFPPNIVRHAVWLYARFTLSFRDIEEMLAERGLVVSYETIRRWFLKFGTVIAANLRRTCRYRKSHPNQIRPDSEDYDMIRIDDRSPESATVDPYTADQDTCPT
jgi:transposase-like protein